MDLEQGQSRAMCVQALGFRRLEKRYVLWG